jgi:hypothetical protein
LQQSSIDSLQGLVFFAGAAAHITKKPPVITIATNRDRMVKLFLIMVIFVFDDLTLKNVTAKLKANNPEKSQLLTKCHFWPVKCEKSGADCF